MSITFDATTYEGCEPVGYLAGYGTIAGATPVNSPKFHRTVQHLEFRSIGPANAAVPARANRHCGGR
jgi:hypothetical protein